MKDKTAHRWNVELTDTFAGEANYGWVRRYAFTAPAGTSRREIIRRAKAAADLTGVKGETEGDGCDGYTFRPRGQALVMFVAFNGPAA